MSTAMDIAATSTTIEPPLFDSGIEPLEGASGNTARTILVALCVDASTREKALRNYYRLMHYEQQLCGQELIRNASAITTTMGSTKRKAVGEPKICLQCDEIFTEDQNQLGACWYHSGKRILAPCFLLFSLFFSLSAHFVIKTAAIFVPAVWLVFF